jgi:hypothetical protein
VSWIRIDDKLTTHPKWLALDPDAKLFWFCAAVWCGAHNNDGLVPEHVWPLVAFSAGLEPKKVPALVDQLCRRPQALPSEEGRPNPLMRRVPKARGGGLEFHNWSTYQPTKKQVEKKKAVDAAADEMKALHRWLHKSAPGKKVKAIVEARDGLRCCYCGEGPLRTDGDRKGSTRRTFDLIDPSTKDSWEWQEGVALRPAEIVRVSDLWCVACGYCNAAKGKRAPDETDGYRIIPGKGPSADLPRSAAIQSVFGPALGTDLAGYGRNGPGSGRAGAGQSGAAAGSVPRLMQSAGGVVRVRPEDPAHPDHHHTEGVM